MRRLLLFTLVAVAVVVTSGLLVDPSPAATAKEAQTGQERLVVFETFGREI